MATESICKFYQYGHCKFSEKCRKRHVHEICEIEACDRKNCSKRHPRLCRYFQIYHRCKFQPCSYLHEETKELIELKNVKKMLEDKTAAIETLVSRIASLESKVQELQITPSIVASSKLPTDYEPSPRDEIPLLQRIKEIEDNNFVLLHAVDDLEHAVKSFQAYMSNQSLLSATSCYVCDQCSTSFQTEPSWRNHMRRVHRS